MNFSSRHALTCCFALLCPALGALAQSQLDFSSHLYTVAENEPGFAAITVTRTGGSAGLATVSYRTVDGTAVAGVDYLAASGTLVFAPGQTNASFVVRILDNPLAEGDKAVGLTLTNATGGATFPGGLLSASATLRILDNDVPHSQLSFNSPSYLALEGSGSATITVVRNGGSAGMVSVRYQTVEGTATAGLDYSPVSGVLVFASGEVSKTFVVPLLADPLVEATETVGLLLTNATGGATLPDGLPTASATLQILDDDFASGQLAFSSPLYTVAENEPGFATITVIRTGESAGPTAVNYHTVDGTGVAGADYLPASGTLVFAAGQTNASFQVVVLDDPFVEGDKTVGLILTNATGGATFPDGLLSTSATLRLLDNDLPPGRLGFSAAGYSAPESSGSVTITVVRTGGSAGLVTVRYQTVGGTATAGLDYSSASGVVVFASGEVSKTFVVPLLADQLVEGSETVGLVLTNATGGATLAGGASSANATLTLLDSDSAPVAPPVAEHWANEKDAFQFSFRAEAGYDYFVEFRQAYQGDWLALTNFRAKLQPIEAVVTDSITNRPGRFYRIRKQDCQCD